MLYTELLAVVYFSSMAQVKVNTIAPCKNNVHEGTGDSSTVSYNSPIGSISCNKMVSMNPVSKRPETRATCRRLDRGLVHTMFSWILLTTSQTYALDFSPHMYHLNQLQHCLC